MFARKFAISKHQFPAKVRSLHDSAQFFTYIGRNGVPVIEPVLGHDEFRICVEYDQVRVVAGRDPSLARTESGESSWTFTHPFRDVGQRKPSPAGFGPHERQG